MDTVHRKKGGNIDPGSDDPNNKAYSEHAELRLEKELGSVPDFDMPPEEERRMVRKCDWRILPIVSALYVMSFLNRVNIGKLSPIISLRRLQDSSQAADKPYLITRQRPDL